MYGLRRVAAGEYQSPDGTLTVLREDYPSMDEWDATQRDVTWFVVPTRNAASAGLPEAMHESGTLRECAGWVLEFLTKPDAAIVWFLRERLTDIPVHVIKEGGPYFDGVNVYRFERDDPPKCKGTMVLVMYSPGQESERLHPQWKERTRELLLAEFGVRWRPHVGSVDWGGILIEDADTEYAKERKTDYEKRESLGFRPLHEIGA